MNFWERKASISGKIPSLEFPHLERNWQSPGKKRKVQTANAMEQLISDQESYALMRSDKGKLVITRKDEL